MKTAIKTQPTQIQGRRNTAERCMERCMGLLEWDEDQYNNFWLDAGMEYLQLICKGDEWATKGMAATALYWKWWRNHWTLREEEYLQGTARLTQMQLYWRREIYKQHNRPVFLAAELHPTSIVLRDSYNKMIDELHKTRP